jgi:glycerate 2-kinase
MTTDLVADVRHIYSRAIERVRADGAVKAALRRESGRMIVADTAYAIPEQGVYLIALGKAAVAMSGGAVEQLGNVVRAGVAVTKAEDGRETADITVLRGSHPVPDERSLAAGGSVAAFARQIPAGALVVCLISGGGSALVEALRAGVTLDNLRSVTSDLLRAGASIQELNAVRSRLSRLKAGGLLSMLAHTTVVNLIVSDVLGDELQAIASGPTVNVRSSLQAEDVLERYGVSATLPTEETAADDVSEPATFVIANVSLAMHAAADAARELGYEPILLTRGIDGEAREVGRLFGSIVRDARSELSTLVSGSCLIAGGETVVTLRGEGIGGRNTEAALAAALRLSGTPAVALGFLATDGDDGVTGAAGAIVDGDTVRPQDVLAGRAALDANDTFTFLSERVATWVTGPSGTNVNDLVIGLVG